MKRFRHLAFSAILALLVAPIASQAEILFGAGIGEIDTDGTPYEVLYEVDTDAATADRVCEFEALAPDNQSSPNGLGFDAVNQRLYFSINTDTGDGSASVLWFCDLNSGEIVEAGTLAGQAAGATFDQVLGQYLYILNRSDDLSAVSLKADGTIDSEALVAPEFSGSDEIVFRGGDLAIDCDGVIYGSSLGTGGGSKVFFSIDTDDDYAYSLIHEDLAGGNNDTGFATAKQLSFGQDGTLFAQKGGTYWPVNTENGEQGTGFGIPSGAPIAMSDLASGLDCFEACAITETAWADGDRYVDRGNWATFTEYVEGDQVIIFAAQTIEAGFVTFGPVDTDGKVTIDISLTDGFVFSESDGEDNLHIDPYENKDAIPRRNPPPGRFDFKSFETGVSASITVPEAEFYGIHLVVDDISECPTRQVCADFTKVPAGGPVENLNAVLDGLTISTPTDGAISMRSGENPAAYGAPNSACGGDPILNGGMDPVDGGFADNIAKENGDAHEYRFEFESIVKGFYLRMLDNGDFNPNRGNDFSSSMTAFDAALSSVANADLSFDAAEQTNPRSSADFGDLTCGAGDAVDAEPGEPGNYLWSVVGDGINSVELKMNDGGNAWDPNIAFDTLCVDKYIVR